MDKRHNLELNKKGYYLLEAQLSPMFKCTLALNLYKIQTLCSRDLNSNWSARPYVAAFYLMRASKRMRMRALQVMLYKNSFDNGSVIRLEQLWQLSS